MIFLQPVLGAQGPTRGVHLDRGRGLGEALPEAAPDAPALGSRSGAALAARHDPGAASPSLPPVGARRHGSQASYRSSRTRPVPQRRDPPAQASMRRSLPSRARGARAPRRREPPLEPRAADRAPPASLRLPRPMAHAWPAPAHSASPRAARRRSLCRPAVASAPLLAGAASLHPPSAGGAAGAPGAEGGELTAGEVGSVRSSAGGAVKLGISRSVRTVRRATSVDSSTAAAAAIGQRCIARLGAEDPAPSRGRAFASRAAAARIAARVAGAGRSSSASLAAR